jgi:hypothetical protein
MSVNDLFTPFYVVWTKPLPTDPKEQGTRKPVKRSYAHVNPAADAAASMAEKYPGRKFFVLQSICRFQVEGDKLHNSFDNRLLKQAED